VVEFGGLPELKKLLHTYQQQGRTPWLVADGYHLGRGPAPLARYYAALTGCPGAVLLLDDTQGFGVVGRQPMAARPLGQGGGGSLAAVGLAEAAAGPELLTITSLAKGLGVPVAVLAGRASRLRQFEQHSDTRVHTSPVSAWHAWAAAQALRLDARHGEAARLRLGRRIGQLRAALGRVGLRPGGGWFPVQKLVPTRATAALGLHQQLRQAGINTLLLTGEHRPGVPEIALCLRADHSAADLGRVAAALGQAVRRHPDWFSSHFLLGCHECPAEPC
jgi:8-amino-7-oxononanoate synthase